MSIDRKAKDLGRAVSLALAVWLGMSATSARAETITSVTQYAYDAAGRPTCTAVRMSPAAFGSLPVDACTLGTQGPDGPDRITYTAYDAADRVSQVTSGYLSGSPRVEKTATYTDNGQEKTVADGKGNLTTYEYDGFDRLAKVRYPNASGTGSSMADYEAYGYDANDNRTTWRRRDGTSVTFTYDAVNRAQNGLRGEAYAYDNLGRRTLATYSGQTALATYDALGRMTSETTNDLTMSYQYDLAGNRTRITWPDAFYATYGYDAAGQMTGVWENGVTAMATITYDDRGRRTAIYRANLAQSYYSYDAASRLSSLALDLPGSGPDQTWTFGYNAASQVISRVSTNSLYEWSNAQASKTYAVNGLNQLTATAGTAIGYDARGNLTSDGTRGYCYDLLNNLTSAWMGAVNCASPTNVIVAEEAYEPTGRLWRLSANGTTTNYLYAGSDMVGEYANGVILRRYMPGPGTDAPLVWYEGAGVSDRRFLLTDPQGSVVSQVSGAGVVLATNTYDEYGVPAAGNQGRFQYTGQLWIGELGFYHYKARAYSPTLGRFLQTDPTGYDDGLNWYAYTGNDPVNGTDPTGLAAAKEEEPGPCESDFDKTSKCSVIKGGSGHSNLSPNRSFEEQSVDFNNPDLNGQPESDRQLLIGGGTIILVGVTGGTVNGLLSGTGLAATTDFGLGGGRGLISKHGLEAMTEHNVSREMVAKAMEKGQMFLDPKNNSVVRVLQGEMGRGKDLAVAVNRLTGKVATVMTNAKAIRPRFIPW